MTNEYREYTPLNFDIKYDDDFIATVDNFLPPNECQRIIDFFEDQNKIHQTYDREKSSHIVKDKSWSPTHIESKTSNGIFYRTYAGELWGMIHMKLAEVYEQYAKNYLILDACVPQRITPSIKVQRTDKGGGYHVWHCENGSVNTSNRNAVYTIYLNDVVEGGETEYLFQSKRIGAKQGRLCIFPASFTHMHRGNPPLSNVKYIMTGWFEHAQ